MKKKAILGFMTGAAIVAATTGSYATWDKLSATASNTVTLRKPVTVAVTLDSALTSDNNLHESDNPTYTGEYTVTASEIPSGKDLQWNFNTEIKNGETVVTDKFNIKYSGADGTEVTNPAATNTPTTYKVNVTPMDGATELAGTELSVSVTAKLEQTTPAGE